MFVLQRNAVGKVEMTTRPEAHNYRASITSSVVLVNDKTSATDDLDIDEIIRQMLHGFQDDVLFKNLMDSLKKVDLPSLFQSGGDHIKMKYEKHINHKPRDSTFASTLKDLEKSSQSASTDNKLIMSYRDIVFQTALSKLPAIEKIKDTSPQQYNPLLVRTFKWMLASTSSRLHNKRTKGKLDDNTASKLIYQTVQSQKNKSTGSETPVDVLNTVDDDKANDDYTLNGMYQAHARRGAMPPGSYVLRGNAMLGPVPQPGCAVRVEDTLPLVPSNAGRAALLDWCPSPDDWHQYVFSPVKLSTLYHQFTSERTDDPKNALSLRDLQNDTQVVGKIAGPQIWTNGYYLSLA